MPATAEAKTDPAAALMTDEAIAGFFQTEAPDATAEPEATSTEATAAPADDKTPTDTPVAEAKKAEAVKAPVADPVAEDLSGYAEVLQRLMKSADPDTRALARKEIDKGYLRQSQFTKLTQEIADVRKNAEAFDLAMKNPALRKAWNDIMANPSAQVADAQSDDQEAETLAKLALEADGKGLAKFLKERDARILAKATDAANAVYEKRAIEPGRKFKAVEEALEARIGETGIDPEAVRDAVRKAIKYPGNGPIESWEPSKAWELIEPFLANGKANTPQAASRAALPIPKVAPPGRGASAAAPAPQPAHRRLGKDMSKLSAGEHAEEFAALLSEKLGRPISVADLGDGV